MKILSVGDQVKPGTYQLHSRFRHAMNFTDSGCRRLVTLVTPDIGAGPVNIVVQGPFPRQSASAAPWCDTPSASGHSKPEANPILRINRYSIVFANRRYVLNGAQSYRSLLPVYKETSRTIFRKNLKKSERSLIRAAHPKSLAFLLDRKRNRHFRTDFEKALRRQLAAGAKAVLSTGSSRLIAGCGFGLTPGGDDFIAGALLGLHLSRRFIGRRHDRLMGRIYSGAKGRNPLSNAFLLMARRGRATQITQHLVSALFSRDENRIRNETRKAMQSGETSGADFLTGFIMATKKVLI